MKKKRNAPTQVEQAMLTGEGIYKRYNSINLSRDAAHQTPYSLLNQNFIQNFHRSAGCKKAA